MNNKLITITKKVDNKHIKLVSVGKVTAVKR